MVRSRHVNLRLIEEAGAARTVLVGVDVGKHEALALVADGRGELLEDPVLLALDEPGARSLETVIERCASARSATVVRVGVEACGHYHRLLVHRLRSAGWDTVDLSPAQVHATRSQMGYRRLKSDLRDAAAMIELLVRGAGRPRSGHLDTFAELQAWVGHRNRKQAARVALGNQLLANVDLVFPSLQGCFSDPLDCKSFWLVLQALEADVDRIVDLSITQLRAIGADNRVRLESSKAAAIIDAAQRSLRLPERERQARLAIVRSDTARLHELFTELERAEATIARLLETTSAAVLTSLPGVGAVRAGDYATALGDPDRFPTAEHAYRGERVGSHPVRIGRTQPQGKHLPRGVGPAEERDHRVGPPTRPARSTLRCLQTIPAGPRQEAQGRQHRRRPPRPPTCLCVDPHPTDLRPGPVCSSHHHSRRKEGDSGGQAR